MADYPSPPPVPGSTPAKTSGMAVTSLGRELMVSPARRQGGRIFVVTLADGAVWEMRASQLDSLRWTP